MIDKFYDLIEDRIPIPNKYKMRKDKNFFIALPQNVGVLVSLNSIAGFILSNCDGKKSIIELTELLHERFSNVDKIRIKKDIVMCIRKLEAMNLICGYN